MRDDDATAAGAPNPLLEDGSGEDVDFASEEGDAHYAAPGDDENDFDDSTSLVDPSEYMNSLREREEAKIRERADAEVATDAIPHLGEVSLPARLGEYTLTELLGLGGMAEVFLARQDGIEGFQKTLVVKRIHPHLSQDDRFRQMFLREARVAAGLQHRNIVQLFELREDRGIYYMAMEFVDGLTLLRLARRAWRSGLSLPMELAVTAAADAAAGLHHAHTYVDDEGVPKKIVHRDVSPDNLIINRQGLTKLLDFGVAKAADSVSVTRAGEVKGKIPYMAPEQLHGKPVDGRADLYSLGATLYWLLTGRRPFHGDGDVALMQSIAYEEPTRPSELNPEIPAPVEDVILRLLAKNPEDRFQSGEELAETLFQYVPPNRREVSTFVEEAMALEDADDSGPISTASFIAATPRTAHFITTSRRLAKFLPQESTEAIDVDKVRAERAHAEAGGGAPPAADGGLADDLFGDADVVEPDAAPGDASVSGLLNETLNEEDPHTDPGARPLALTPSGAFEASQNTGGVDDPPDPLGLASGGGGNRNKLLAAAGGAAAVVLLLLVGVFVLGGEDPVDVPPPPPPPVDDPVTGSDDEEAHDDAVEATDDGDPAGDEQAADEDGWEIEAVEGGDEAADDGEETAEGTDKPAAGGDETAEAAPSGGDDQPASAAATTPTKKKKRSAPAMMDVRAKAPKYVQWKSPRGTKLGRGDAKLRIPARAKSVVAVDLRRMVSTRVVIKGGVVDYANAPKGTLDIRAFPYAKVLVGKSTLGTTPFAPKQVVAGRYKLTLVYKDKTKTQTVTVKPGGTAKVRANMTE